MIKRIVATSFWTDMEVIDNYSIEDKFFYLYLLTNDKSTQIGIYPLPKKVMSFETGFTTDVIQVLIERFSNNYKKIVYSEKTQEVTILDSLEFSILSGGKPVSDLLEREITAIKDSSLILATYKEMKEFWLLSKRQIDKTVMKLFESEMTNRNINFSQNHNQKQNQKQNHNQIHIQNHNHNHNQESSITNGSTNRRTNREIKEKNENEEIILERYIHLIKQTCLQPNKEITQDNILEVFYEEMIGQISPEVNVRFEMWQEIYSKPIILEALYRSLNAKKPISYANKIIESWLADGVVNYQDIIKSDRNFNQQNI